jgi:hypothetical protein
MICFILNVLVLAKAAVYSEVGALGAGCSSAAGVACPVETGAGSVQTFGALGPFTFSMPALVSPALASLVVPAPLAGMPVSEVSC